MTHNNAYSAIKLKQAASRKRQMAPKYDPIRYEMDCAEADLMELDSSKIIAPEVALKTGSGGEVIPPFNLGLSGL